MILWRYEVTLRRDPYHRGPRLYWWRAMKPAVYHWTFAVLWMYRFFVSRRSAPGWEAEYFRGNRFLRDAPWPAPLLWERGALSLGFDPFRRFRGR